MSTIFFIFFYRLSAQVLLCVNTETHLRLLKQNLFLKAAPQAQILKMNIPPCDSTHGAYYLDLRLIKPKPEPKGS